MGFLDRLFGGDEPRDATAPQRDRALEQYRHVLRTAPPETIERVHADAFARLSEEQRVALYEELSRGAATGERPLSSEPETLARAASRAEQRRPGTIERILDGLPGASTSATASTSGTGVAAGGLGGSLLSGVAGFVIGSALTSAFLPWGSAGLVDAHEPTDLGAFDPGFGGADFDF